MNIKTLYVFYGGDFLPYKDKERQVHYPNVGSDFQGAENITNIRFYIDEISSNNTTFAVAIELPNGKIGSKVLSPAQYDSEIGEYYVTLKKLVMFPYRLEVIKAILNLNMTRTRNSMS